MFEFVLWYKNQFSCMRLRPFDKERVPLCYIQNCWLRFSVSYCIFIWKHYCWNFVRLFILCELFILDHLYFTFFSKYDVFSHKLISRQMQIKPSQYNRFKLVESTHKQAQFKFRIKICAEISIIYEQNEAVLIPNENMSWNYYNLWAKRSSFNSKWKYVLKLV